MKVNTNILLGLLGVSILANVWLAVRVGKVEDTIASGRTISTQHMQEEKKEGHDDFELIETMAYNQRFIEKLYFAGSNSNWELADFYLEELEEKIEDLVKHQVVEDEIDISSLAKEIIPPKIEAVEQSLKKQDAKLFQRSFLSLVEGCNACHVRAKHGFVQIQAPASNSYYSQLFKKQEPIK